MNSCYFSLRRIKDEHNCELVAISQTIQWKTFILLESWVKTNGRLQEVLKPKFYKRSCFFKMHFYAKKSDFKTIATNP